MQGEKQTILVTGGAGFIGGNFVLGTVGDYKVVDLDALTYAGNPDTLASVSDNPDHIFVQGRIGDRELVDRLLTSYRPSAVVNFAAETHVDRSIDGPRAFVQTNVVETHELLEAVLSYWSVLEGEDHEHTIDLRLHRLHPSGTPRPQLRADVVDDRDAEPAHRGHEPEIEVGKIDRDEDVRSPRPRFVGEAPEHRVRARQDAERLGETGHRHAAEIADEPRPGGAKPVAAESEDLGAGRAREQLACERRFVASQLEGLYPAHAIFGASE